MRKLSIICLWAFIIFLLLSFIMGIVATILQFVVGDIANGFSDLSWTCINGWILTATVGIKAHEKGGDNNAR
jgi:hypothetical protein